MMQVVSNPGERKGVISGAQRSSSRYADVMSSTLAMLWFARYHSQGDKKDAINAHGEMAACTSNLAALTLPARQSLRRRPIKECAKTCCCRREGDWPMLLLSDLRSKVSPFISEHTCRGWNHEDKDKSQEPFVRTDTGKWINGSPMLS